MVIKTYPLPKEVPKLKAGDTRVFHFFAWLPKTVNNKLIWLHRYSKHEVYRLITKNEWFATQQRISQAFSFVDDHGKLIKYPIKPYHPDGQYGWCHEKYLIG